MAIQDFNCTYANAVGVNGDATKDLGLTFPDAYLHADTMATLASAICKYDGSVFCEMPFCRTLEAEAMGGIINLGDSNTGPRAKEYICHSVEELLDLPDIDFTKGRINESLKACEILRSQGAHVVFEVTGPFTMMNALIDPKYVFKAMRKQPELMEKVLKKFGEQILEHMKQVKARGVEFLSYADSAGGVNILGPKMAEQVVDMFTYDFVKEAVKLTDDHTMLVLCPKVTLSLIGTDKAEFSDYLLDQPMLYNDACVELLGKVKIAGQMCVKNVNYRLENRKFKEVILK